MISVDTGLENIQSPMKADAKRLFACNTENLNKLRPLMICAISTEDPTE